MEIDQLDEELENLNNKLNNQPDDINLLYKIAEIKRRLGFLKSDRAFSAEALTNINKALSLSPNDYFGFLERGTTFFTLNKHEEAIDDFTRSLEIQKTSRGYYNRGIARWNKIQNEIKNRTAYSNEIQGEFELVLKDYLEAIKLDPTNSHAFYNLGVVLMQVGQFKVALEYFNKSIKLRPNDYLSYFNRAICYEFLTSPRYTDKAVLQKAISDYNKVIEISPNYSPALFNRALCYEHEGEERYKDKLALKLAIQDYTRILDIEPYNSYALFNRGWACEFSGDIIKAIADYNAFLQMSKDKSEKVQIRKRVKELKILGNKVKRRK